MFIRNSHLTGHQDFIWQEFFLLSTHYLFPFFLDYNPNFENTLIFSHGGEGIMWESQPHIYAKQWNAVSKRIPNFDGNTIPLMFLKVKRLEQRSYTRCLTSKPGKKKRLKINSLRRRTVARKGILRPYRLNVISNQARDIKCGVAHEATSAFHWEDSQRGQRRPSLFFYTA